MVEWNARSFVEDEIERLYMKKRILYALAVVTLCSFLVLGPLTLIFDDIAISAEYGILHTTVQSLYDNNNIPEIALSKIDEIRVLIEFVGLEPTDNSAYFSNTPTRDVQHFLDFLTTLEVRYKKIIAWRNREFNDGFNSTTCQEYEDLLSSTKSKMIVFCTPVWDSSLSFIVHGAYVNKYLKPFSLFNYRMFIIYYLPLFVISLFILAKIKDSLQNLKTRCMLQVSNRYNRDR